MQEFLGRKHSSLGEGLRLRVDGVNLYDRFGDVHVSRLVKERLNVRYQIKDFLILRRS